uniref:Autophagy-related protein 13 n=1 Tax=Panagrellus redivivus TaxID=6233 RepID=A0A7E4V9F6_PANRE
MADSAEKDPEYTLFCQYARNFSTRVIHSIVQARMGETVSHACVVTPNPRTWFSVEVDEIGETSAYLKSHVKQYPPFVKSLNIDFILYLPSGEVLPLETWSIAMGPPDKDDLGSYMQNQTYFALSQLLRSAIAASRVTPAYRYYVKDQSADNYVITYRVYSGEPDLTLLGQGSKSITLGEVNTKFGTIMLNLNYRTNMELNPIPYDNVYSQSVSCVNPAGEAHIMRRHSTMPVMGTRQDSCHKLSPTSPGVPQFSTSPGSQEFPFGSQESQGKLGRSPSSSVSSTTSAQTALKSSKSSPQASSSFPQRNSRRARLRNNSFPFASLLYDSQYSDDERLPKVDEDADLGNIGGLRHRSSPAGGNTKLRTSPSAPGFIDEVTENMSIKESKSSASLASSKRSIENVIEEKDETPEAETEVESEATIKSEKPEEAKDPGSEDDMESSDDSYVKVYSYSPSEDLGEDLTEFVKEVRIAPTDLGSFTNAQTSALKDQLNVFKERAVEFDTFIARLKDSDDVC